MTASLKAPTVPSAANPPRVAVTGLGLVTPLGVGAKKSWHHALKGQSGIDKIKIFDASDLSSRIAGEVTDFNPEDFIPARDIKKMDRFSQFSLAAAKMAVQDSGIEFNAANQGHSGCLLGVGIGGFETIEQQMGVLSAKGPRRVSPFFIPKAISNIAPGHITMEWGLRGANFSLASACASGGHAIGEAYWYIKNRRARIMLAGGVEGAVCRASVAGFASMKALSTRNDAPIEASRPWDRERDGFVIADGCGMLLLEDLAHAKARGARIYAELSGYGATSDAYHITHPHPDGLGALGAMEQALSCARLEPEQISYINAHGTSTPLGDEIEAGAICKLFKAAAKGLWVSSTKSMTGHTLGAAGAIEAAFSVMSLHTAAVPPTINLHNPSQDYPLDFIAHKAREKKLKHVMSNSFGFGGTNTALVFSSVD